MDSYDNDMLILLLDDDLFPVEQEENNVALLQSNHFQTNPSPVCKYPDAQEVIVF